MKTLLLTAVAAFAMFQIAYSQTNQEQMATIDKAIKETNNNIATYQKTEEIKNGTSSKVVFKSGSELKLVTITVTENNINKKVDLYFSNRELIYATQVGTDVTTGKVVDNEQAYVNNNQAITWIKTGNILVDNSSKKFKAMNSELMAYASNLSKGSSTDNSIQLAIK